MLVAHSNVRLAPLRSKAQRPLQISRPNSSSLKAPLAAQTKTMVASTASRCRLTNAIQMPISARLETLLVLVATFRPRRATSSALPKGSEPPFALVLRWCHPGAAQRRVELPQTVQARWLCPTIRRLLQTATQGMTLRVVHLEPSMLPRTADACKQL